MQDVSTLVAQAREAGVTDERQRIAGEIHDTIAQGLTGVITQLEAANQVKGDPAELAAHAVARPFPFPSPVPVSRSHSRLFE